MLGVPVIRADTLHPDIPSSGPMRQRIRRDLPDIRSQFDEVYR
jgi:hypothetical protein